MLAANKWVKIESPDEPAVRVARRALGGRLGLVWHYLAACGEDERGGDVEDVHQLRVSTRRSMAAVRAFQEVTSGRRRWFKKRLKHIRKAAGEARDLDVLQQRLARQKPLADDVAWADFMSALGAEQQAARQPIGEIFQQLRSKGFKRRLAKLLAKLRVREVAVNGEPLSVVCLARNRLASAADDFHAAEPAESAPLDALHQFRIAGKQLRYAMELFAGAFEPEFRHELYPRVEELQEKLGQINDLAAAEQRYQTWLESSSDPPRCALLHALLESSRAAQTESVRCFREYWTADRATLLRDGIRDAIGRVKTGC